MKHSLFGNLPSVDTLADLEKRLQWWNARPKLARTQRGQQRIRALSRQVAAFDLPEPPSYIAHYIP